MFPIHADLAVTICFQPLIPANLKSFGRQHEESFPILLKQFPDGKLLFIMELPRLPLMPHKQFLVVLFNVRIMRNRHKQVGTVIVHFTLHIPLLPAGIRVAEAYPEMIVGPEPGEELRFMNSIPDTTADTGGVVKDQQRRHPANVFKNVLQPLADTFGGLTSKNLAVAVVAVREGQGKIFFAGQLPFLIKIGFPKIHLAGPGIPDQFQVCFLHLLGTALFQVALDNTVAAIITVFLFQPLINPFGCVVLLAPVLFILIKPFLDDRLERIQLGRELLYHRWLR